MSQVRICGHCQTQFVGRSNKDYCSDPCKRRAQDERDRLAALAAQNQVVTPAVPVKTTPTRKGGKKLAAPVPVQVDALPVAVQGPDPMVVKLQSKENDKKRRHERQMLESQQKHELAMKEAATQPARPVESVPLPNESVGTISPPTPPEALLEASETVAQPEPPVEEAGISLGAILKLAGAVGLAYGAIQLFGSSEPKPQAKPKLPLTPKPVPKPEAKLEFKPGLDGLKERLAAQKAQGAKSILDSDLRPIKPASQPPQTGPTS